MSINPHTLAYLDQLPPGAIVGFYRDLICPHCIWLILFCGCDVSHTTHGAINFRMSMCRDGHGRPRL